ncbi:hypothetical protein GQ457_11G023490 [Hibiscus cannabinus]
MSQMLSLTLWRQEGKEDQGITFVQVRFYGYCSMYKQWGGYALFWSMLDSFKLMRCCVGWFLVSLVHVAARFSAYLVSSIGTLQWYRYQNSTLESAYRYC